MRRQSNRKEEKKQRCKKISGKLLAGTLLFAVFAGLFGVKEAGMNEQNSSFAAGRSRLLAAEDAEKEMFFNLTQEEEEILAKLRGQTLFLGVSEEGIWEENGAAAYGLAAPLLDVLHYEFGLEIEVVHGTWEENAAALAVGKLNFLFGVPGRWQEEIKDEQELAENGMYCSTWLYENLYVLVEYQKESHAFGTASDQEELRPETAIAYVAGNPVSEWLIPHITDLWKVYQAAEGSAINSAGVLEPAFLPCQDEEAVFDALINGSAAAGLLPEDALFSYYPRMDFSVISDFSQYGSNVALGTTDKELNSLFAILNRYLDATQEGDLLRQAIRTQQQSIRQEKICKTEQKLLKKLQERGKKLQYAQAGLDAVPAFWHDESGAHGELLDFLAFVEECTGIAFEESALYGEEALQALEDGELFFVLGMPLVPNEQGYCYAGTYRKQRLVPLVPAADAGQFTGMASWQTQMEAIARRYWGVVQELMPLLAGTGFDGHTVGFSDERKLFEAMRAGEIGGMLIGEESYDALLLSGECPYTTVEGISFEMRSGLAFSEADSDAAGLFERLWQFYSLLHRQTKSAAGQYRAAYVQKGLQQEKITKIAWALFAAALFFAAAFVLALRSGRKRKI